MRRRAPAHTHSAPTSAGEQQPVAPASMKTPLLLTCVCVCVFAAAALAPAGNQKDSKPPATAVPAESFTSEPKPKPKTTTPTPEPKTTTPTPEPTTPPKPKTTTLKPTTKPKPTTPKPTTKPKPTTPKPPTPPPPKPTPATNLTRGNYSLSVKSGVCLRALMALQIRLATPKANGTFIVQPKLTSAEGFCRDTKANLTLVFTQGFITFIFNKSSEKSYVSDLSFNLSYPLHKAGAPWYAKSNHSLQLFPARVGHAYSCRAETLHMGDGLYLDVNQDLLQAFNLTPAGDFGTSDPCPADQPDYRVAIAVGVTLLVLIAIVVVAYLLGRHRRSDGYQSL